MTAVAVVLAANHKPVLEWGVAEQARPICIQTNNERNQAAARCESERVKECLYSMGWECHLGGGDDDEGCGDATTTRETTWVLLLLDSWQENKLHDDKRTRARPWLAGRTGVCGEKFADGSEDDGLQARTGDQDSIYLWLYTSP